ncbi:MAG: hypothetical protein AAGL10_15505 [Pseudomonadota bacterium]
MASQPLVLTDPKMLAEFVRQSQLKTILEKRFAAPADLGAILFRDGAIVDGFKGTQFSLGGVWENLKGVIGGSHHYEIMLVDLKPFTATIPVRGMSKDNVEIVGEATFELQINPDKPTNALGLMRGISRNESDPDEKGGRVSAGRKALMVSDVVERIEPHFRERVFGSILSRHNAEEIRGNRGMQDQIQADMMKEAERILGDLGVMASSATANFATNEAERQQFELARVKREEEIKDFQLEVLKRQVEREADSTAFMLNTQLDQAKLKQANDDELRLMVLDSETGFIDARETHARRQELEALDHEAGIVLAEAQAKTKIALSEIDDSMAKTEATIALTKVENELHALKEDFRLKREQIANDARRKQAKEEAEHDDDIDDIKRGKRKKDHEQEREEAEDWAELAAKNRDRKVDTDLREGKGQAEIRIMEKDAQAKNEIDKMLAAGRLTPEQLREYMPGMSESAAQVAVARAQAEGRNADQMIDLVREMTRDSRDHEHRMFETGMKGGGSMAAGLGGKSDGGFSGAGGSKEQMLECPNCKTLNPARAKYCKACQTQLRT